MRNSAVAHAKKFTLRIALCNNTGVIIIPITDKNLILLIRYMARDGLDCDEIVKRLGITKKKVNALKKQDENLLKELEYSKLLTDYAVEDALLKKALGATSVETKETMKNSGVESITVTKEIPSDTAALKFWLEHRCPERWAEKSEANQAIDEKLEKISEEITRQALSDGGNDEVQ